MKRLFRRRNRYLRQDRIAMRIAALHNMTANYKAARRAGLKPMQALSDWDLLTEEARATLEE